MRPAFLRLHRWIGLFTALFLGLAGITGSLLAFKEELESMINPRLFVVESLSNVAAIDPFTLREQVESYFPQARVDYMPFTAPGESARFFLMPRPAVAGETATALDVDEVFFNPYSGEYLGGRKWGALFDGGVFRCENILPFIWRVHEALALPHPWGKFFMGAVALLWTLDCFIGFVLTLPGRSPFFSKWKVAWSIKRGASIFRLIFDTHRSLGLWCWLLLLIFAWSSVMLNLRTQVYQPLMSFVVKFDHHQIRPIAAPDYQPRISWREAQTIGHATLLNQAQSRKLAIYSENSLWYRPTVGAYLYRAHTEFDIRDHGAASDIWIDGRNGEVLAINLERDAAKGNVLSEWLRALHTGSIFGPIYRLFVALLGVVVAVLSVTGVWIWWKKRKARRL